MSGWREKDWNDKNKELLKIKFSDAVEGSKSWILMDVLALERSRDKTFSEVEEANVEKNAMEMDGRDFDAVHTRGCILGVGIRTCQD